MYIYRIYIYIYIYREREIYIFMIGVSVFSHYLLRAITLWSGVPAAAVGSPAMVSPRLIAGVSWRAWLPDIESKMFRFVIAKFRAEPLTFIFWPRVPSKQVGNMFISHGVFWQRICMCKWFKSYNINKIRILADFQHVGRFFCQPFGGNTFWKQGTQTHKSVQIL